MAENVYMIAEVSHLGAKNNEENNILWDYPRIMPSR